VVVTILGEMRRALARPIELPEAQKKKYDQFGRGRCNYSMTEHV